MSEELKDQETPDIEPEVDDDEELELSHTDKLVGVFTEPAATFSKMAEAEPKVKDWLIPLLILIVVVAATNFIFLSNPEIKYQAQEKQRAALEKMVDNGTLTQEQADQQMSFLESRGDVVAITSAVSTVIFFLIFFFIIVGVFFLLVRFGLKGEGGYSTAMVAYGLPMYISILGTIIMVIIGMAMNKLLTGLNLAVFLDMKPSDSLGALLLSKIEPFSIWFYAVISIGFAKMFKSDSTGKYFALVFGLWIGFSIVIYFLAQAVPFFQNFL